MSDIFFPIPFPYTFPLTFGETAAVPILDEVPTRRITQIQLVEDYFHQAGDPDEATEPRYHEAWQNQPTTTPVIYPVQYRFGIYYSVEYFFQQLSTPVFSPDGTGVPVPTMANLLHMGHGELTIVGNA